MNVMRFKASMLLAVTLLTGGCTAPEPPPSPSQAAVVVTMVDWILFFGFDEATLQPLAQRSLDQLADAYHRRTPIKICSHVHADRVGNAAYNRALAARRGDAVRDYLVARGVAADRITIVNKGDTQPLVATAPGVREPQNRRAELFLC